MNACTIIKCITVNIKVLYIVLTPLLLKQSDIELFKKSFHCLHTEATSLGIKANVKLHK